MQLFQNLIRIDLPSLHPFLKIAKYETGKNLSMELYQLCVTIRFFVTSLERHKLSVHISDSFNSLNFTDY